MCSALVASRVARLCVARAQIVGLDETSDFDHRVVLGLLVEHVRRLRAIPAFRAAVLALAVETNYGGPMEATLAWDCLRAPELQPVVLLTDTRKTTKQSVAGVVTTLSYKILYIATLLDYMRADRLLWADDQCFVTCNGPAKTIQNELCSQMLRYRRDVRHSKTDEAGDGVVRIHGKGRGERDDLMMALQMALYWLSARAHDPAFLQKTYVRHV